MVKSILLSTILFLYTSVAFTQSAVINISADVSSKVDIYEPIDGVVQQYIATKSLDLQPNISTSYKVDVDDYCFVRININKSRAVLLLFPNDKVTLSYADNKITIEGSNAKGHDFYHQKVVGGGLGQMMSSVSQAHDKFTDYTDFDKHIEDSFIEPLLKSIDSLEQGKLITNNYAEVIKMDLSNFLYMQLYRSLLGKSRTKTLTDLQIAQRKSVSDKISKIQFNKYSYDELVKNYLTNIGYLSDKRKVEYNNLSQEDKDALLGGYDKTTFGPYVSNMVLPKELRPFLFCGALYVNTAYGFEEFDFNKMLEYFKAEFPDSESFKYVKEMVDKANAKNTTFVKFIDANINSLKELSQLPELKSKYLFVDMWATWCLPCRMEFAHNESLNKLLDKYNNIEKVYISIDKKKDEETWKSFVLKSPLNGYNFIANESLISDITKSVFNGEKISIPRYVLIDLNGNILEAALPRPSQIKELEQVLDKYLKTNNVISITR